MNRWTYLTKTLSPFQQILWKLENRGIATDAERVKFHRKRLEHEKENIRGAILGSPVVEASCTSRIKGLQSDLARLEEAKNAEFQRANAGRIAYDQAVSELRRRRDSGEKNLPSIKSLGTVPTTVRGSAYTDQIADIRKKLRSALDFNIASDDQKAWLLYDAWKLPIQYNVNQQTRKKSVTTDKRALGRLIRAKGTKDEYKDALRGMRELGHISQLLSTFVMPLFDGENIRGRIFSSYGLHRTATGRVASGSDKAEKSGSSDTNQQNQPKSLRDMYVPDEGYRFVQADWAKVEWLLSLYFAGDHIGFKRAQEGEDQHCRFASVVAGKRYGEVWEAYLSGDKWAVELRTKAKRFTHGLNYGMGPRKLAEEADCSESEAKEIIAAFNRAFPLVAKWREEVVAQATKQHYLQTVFGWRRWFWRKDPPEMIAFLPSATGAGMLHHRMIEVDRICESMTGYLSSTTHDSILSQMKEKLAKEYSQRKKAVLEYPFKELGGTSYPCEVKEGRNWLACS